jgi:phage-related baseplate assembly protein
VADVKILDQHPRGQGTVDVLIVGSGGIPTNQLLGLVQAKILGTGNGDELVPINDNVEVRGVEPVNVDFAAELELTAGSPEDIVAAASARARALFPGGGTAAGVTRLRVGEDTTLDRIKAQCMVAGVKKINSSFTDLSVPENGLAVINSFQLTWKWAAEE